MACRVRRRSRAVTHTSAPAESDATPASLTPPTGERIDDYDVGYGKPPRNTRFKPGRSGNPRGRPKGAKNLKTELAEELQERVALREGGMRREVSKQRAMLKSLMAKAVQGDPKAASLIINMVARFLDQSEDDNRSAPLAAEDLAILEHFEAHIRATKT